MLTAALRRQPCGWSGIAGPSAALGDVAGSAGLQRLDDVLLLLMHTKDDDMVSAGMLGDLPDEPDAASPWHREVDQNYFAGGVGNRRIRSSPVTASPTMTKSA